MSKEEFLQRLRSSLAGEVPAGVVEENIRYYDDYISSEARKGSSEHEVTASIGDPRLIAKTIIEATENAEESGRARSPFESYHENAQSIYEEDGRQADNVHTHFFDLSKWYWKLLAVVVTVLFFFVIASIVTGLFSLLMPLMGPAILILLILWIFRGSRR